MHEPMFLPTHVDFGPEAFAKIAARETMLSDDVQNWPKEILQQAYLQADYISDFQPEVHLTEQDPERGYAFGYVQVSNKTEDTKRPSEAALRSEIGVNTSKIVIVVKNKRLQPLDLFIQGDRVLPLTEDRFRKSMFRPQIFDVTKRGPGDSSMTSLLYPPFRQNSGGGGGQVLKADQSKVSSVRPEFLLDAIRDSMSERDIEAFEEMLGKEAAVRTRLLSSQIGLACVEKIAQASPTSGRDHLRAAFEAIPPDVIQISLDDEGYEVKTANSRAWYPERNVINRAELLKMASEDVVRRVEGDGSVTISTAPAVRNTDFQEDEVVVAKSFGQYRVKTTEGKEILGWVWPNCTDLGGEVLPLAVFSNGSQYAVQESVAGNYVGQGSNVIRKDRPEGFGTFGREQNGRVVITVPMHVDGISVVEGRRKFNATTIMGEPVTLIPLAGFKAIHRINDREVGLPGDVFWIPLQGKTSLVESPDAFVKMAHSVVHKNMVEVVSDGVRFSLRGTPFEKLAHQYRENISRDDAVFALASGGLAPDRADYVVKMASCSGTFPTFGNEVKPLQNAYHQAKLAAERFSKESKVGEWRANLVKEASTITDPNTVDKVLSLGFLNDENVTAFVDYLPEIDRGVEKLAEMLVGSRLGLEEVPREAIERALHHMDKVATGLRRLAYGERLDDEYQQ